MADQDADQRGEAAEGIEDKTTLAYKMEHPEEAPGFVASTQDDEETPEEKAARETAEAEAAAAADRETETPEEKAAREAAEAEEDKTKDWTLEDFRKNRKEAEAKMHEATGETAKEKTAREAAEERARVAEEKVTAQEAEKDRLAAEAAKPKVLSEDEQDEIFAKAAEDLRDLDTADPNYVKNYGKIWRKAISDAGLSRAPADPELTADEVANKAWTKFQAKQEAENVKTAEQRERENNERIHEQANEFAKKSGLDMTPGTAHYRLFWDIANNDLAKQEFMKGEKPASLEEQFKWVTEEAKRLTGQVVQQTDAEREAAAAVQRNNRVLGKGVSFETPKEPPKKRSMSEMLEERASLGGPL